MRSALRGVVVASLWFAVALVTGCQQPKPNYNKELPPGAPALRKITDPALIPDLKPAFTNRAGLIEAADRSLGWFAKPSTKQFFPLQGFSHEQIRASVMAFKDIAQTSSSPMQFEQRVLADFDVWESVGWNGEGVVFFTGYCTPIISGSRTRQGAYQYPLYQKPADLVRDAAGKTLGRNINGQIKPYPTGAQIEYYPQLLGLTGHELVWLKDKLERYIVRVQGSAKLQMEDGSAMTIGYAADNGYDYFSIAKQMVKDKAMDPDRAGLPAMRAYFRDHPGELDYYIAQNPRYVFFQEYAGADWPAGSLGFKVEPWRSLATDKSIYPRGCVTMVVTQVPSGSGQPARYRQFMFDQDAGGAIRAPGRADIYMGIGPEAESIAGQQAAEGRLYYFILKPERIGSWAGPTLK